MTDFNASYPAWQGSDGEDQYGSKKQHREWLTSLSNPIKGHDMTPRAGRLFAHFDRMDA